MHHDGFYIRLLTDTGQARTDFLSIPIIVDTLAHGAGRAQYLHYLSQAYHHVRHTCPLLAAAIARCGTQDERYRDALFHYIEEERGHERWILNDIAALGGDTDAVRTGEGGDAVRVMVGYAWYAVEHVSPYALLGMVHVLEGMSMVLAQQAAASIGDTLGVNPGDTGGSGFSYLTSHGALDREHVAFFRDLVDGIHDAQRQHVIVDTARIMYRLFGDVFRGLDEPASASRHAA
jgi:pyrroloquinoline quinone (PQQ) biosynthesis protein C